MHSASIAMDYANVWKHTMPATYLVQAGGYTFLRWLYIGEDENSNATNRLGARTW